MLQQHTSTLIGTVFIASFIAYGSGSAIIESLTSQANWLSTLPTQTHRIVASVLLIVLIHGGLIIALASLLLPFLKRANATLAYAYFATAITSQLILCVSALSYLLLIPLSTGAIDANLNMSPVLELIAQLIKQLNNYAYLMAMAFWAMGGMILACILWRWQLVPILFGAIGLIGYVIFFIGTLTQLWGYPVGFIASIPGGLFEIALSIWLIVKGINTQHLNAEYIK